MSTHEPTPVKYNLLKNLADDLYLILYKKPEYSEMKNLHTEIMGILFNMFDNILNYTLKNSLLCTVHNMDWYYREPYCDTYTREEIHELLRVKQTLLRGSPLGIEIRQCYILSKAVRTELLKSDVCLRVNHDKVFKEFRVYDVVLWSMEYSGQRLSVKIHKVEPKK